MLACNLNGVKIAALWDTGSQVTLVPRFWLNENLPHLRVRALQKLLQDGEKLNLRGANDIEIPFHGWAQLYFTLQEEDGGIEVPMLVCEDTMSEPLIGYNVIAHYLQGESGDDDEKTETLCMAANGTLTNQKAKSLVNLIKDTDSDDGTLGNVKTGRRRTKIPGKSTVNVRCMVHSGWLEQGMSVLFVPDLLQPWPPQLQIQVGVVNLTKGSFSRCVIPVSNPSEFDVFLEGKVCLGEVELLKSVAPLETYIKGNLSADANDQQGNNDTNKDVKWDPPVDLSHLSEEKRHKAMEMLREESPVFSKGEDDMGCLDLGMEIKLKDHNPVQRNYNSIPRPLYKEVKQYLSDLISRGWIQRSTSPYSSPAVCVRKKMEHSDFV